MMTHTYDHEPKSMTEKPKIKKNYMITIVQEAVQLSAGPNMSFINSLGNLIREEQIFNMDEIGLFQKRFSDWTYIKKQKTKPGFKALKDDLNLFRQKRVNKLSHMDMQYTGCIWYINQSDLRPIRQNLILWMTICMNLSNLSTMGRIWYKVNI